MSYTSEQVHNLKDYTLDFTEYHYKDHLFTIVLNRPEKKNALHPVMVNELAFLLSFAKHEKDVRAVIIRANGSVFCAGADLKAFMGGASETKSTIPEPDSQVLIGEEFNSLHKPCLAFVEGNVYAGGFLILCGCTHVIALENTKFGLPEVKRGLFPFQVMAGLLKVMTPRNVLDWCIMGSDLSAQEAKQKGLVTQVSDKSNAVDILNKMTDKIIQNSPTAIRMGLKAYNELRSKDESEQHSYLMGMLMQTLQSKDAREGLQAFKEKRSPIWTGE